MARLTGMFGPVVNLNGEERASLLAKHVAVMEAADKLQTALGNMCPHGRDYQTTHQRIYHLDRAIWEMMLSQVDEVRKTYQRIAERLSMGE